jgi:dipeptidyl aminopeptidase/acylaminoacyl peptidase
MEKRFLEYDDLRKVEYLSAPALSPDGKTALYVVSKADEAGSFKPQVFEIGLDSKASCRLIPDGTQDRPAYSPDGTRIAYIGRKCSRDELQLWVYDRRKKEEKRLTSLRHGVLDFSWSPDGKQLSFTAKWWPEEDGSAFTEMTTEEKTAWEFEREHAPVSVENLMYKFDETFGVTDKSVTHICVVNAVSGEAAALTIGHVSYYSPSWSPDGKLLSFYGKPFIHVKENSPALFLYDLGRGSMRKLDISEHLLDLAPALFSADGKSLVFEAYVQRNQESYLMELFLLNLGDNSILPLFPETEVCHGVDAMPIGRTSYGVENPAFQMSRDGKYIYFISGWDGSEDIYRLPVYGERCIEKITDGKICVHSFSVPVGDTLLYTRGDLLTIAELYAFHLEGKEEKKLTDSNTWLNDIRLAVPVELWAESKDKKARIHGFTVPPANRKEKMLYPTVLYIHGGPDAFYAHDFWFEVQLLAAKGMAVVYCDPRGSSGYGASFASGSFAWGPEAVDDLMTFLDTAAGLGFVDLERTGVTGGSYGGYMTVKLIGTMNRFKAAVAQRNLCNLATSYGTGDMGFIWKAEGQTTQLQNFMSRIDRSLIKNIDHMKTPLLILHAVQDYRCAFEQAEQLFVAMKERNPEVPVRLVAFPGENHNMTRSGKIHFQISHLREMTQWFERFLKERAE